MLSVSLIQDRSKGSGSKSAYKSPIAPCRLVGQLLQPEEITTLPKAIWGQTEMWTGKFMSELL